MRVIAGEAKGRKLKSINNTSTRPTLDRVKESLFNIISPYLIVDTGLDLFAGFGGLGIEAISRGVNSFHFVEKDYRNCQIIKENIKLTGFEERAVVKKADVFTFLQGCQEKYNLILMDPPYNKTYLEKSISLIMERSLLKKNGIIVAEHEKELTLNNSGDLLLIKHKIYGDTGISVFTIGGGE